MEVGVARGVTIRFVPGAPDATLGQKDLSALRLQADNAGETTRVRSEQRRRVRGASRLPSKNYGCGVVALRTSPTQSGQLFEKLAGLCPASAICCGCLWTAGTSPTKTKRSLDDNATGEYASSVARAPTPPLAPRAYPDWRAAGCRSATACRAAMNHPCSHECPRPSRRPASLFSHSGSRR